MKETELKMVSNTVVKNNVKVSCEIPERKVININISQHSFLVDLIETIRTRREPCNASTSASVTPPVAPVAFATFQFTFGCICTMLAINVLTIQLPLTIYYSNTLFWVGIPFILSGTLDVVAYRWPRTFWVALSFISHLLTFSATIPGIVFIDKSMRDLPGIYKCDLQDYDTNVKWEECQNEFRQYQAILSGLMVMLKCLVFFGLITSIISISHGLIRCYNSCSYKELPEEKVDSLQQSDVIVV
ncbi:uncharacterized protein LOC135054944 isoform X2 [Pseudophryne corroboree]|uniref:uncharacterized protein LOC135054944 isoform X2 n=1 Tax=Pseudophryne corroboree TaxID=495146 RepID=UPI0030816D86